MSWRNTVFGGCKFLVTIEFYFIWGMSGGGGFRESLFTGLVPVCLLCLETNQQPFLETGAGSQGVCAAGVGWVEGPDPLPGTPLAAVGGLVTLLGWQRPSGAKG